MKEAVYIGRYNGIIGGIERYMQKSAELLRAHDFRVHYLYTENGGREQERFCSSFDSVSQLSAGNVLLESAHIIIIHNIIPGEFLKEIPAEKSFFFAHDHNIYCRRHHYYTPLGRINCHRKYNKFICGLCSLGRNEAPPLEEYRKFTALVLSDFMAENLRKNGFEKVVKLPAFIKTSADERPFMPEGVLRILFLGQLIRGKGADLMLKALAQLDISFACTIAGEGNDRPMLEKMVLDHNLQDKVKFTGFVKEPETLWTNCDLFFFPVRWQEPFGLVCLEAMAHGVPVAAFDLGGVREYLNEECACLIPEKDIDAAVRILKTQAAQPETLKQLGKNGLQLVREKFTEEKFVSAFTLLSEVLK